MILRTILFAISTFVSLGAYCQNIVSDFTSNEYRFTTTSSSIASTYNYNCIIWSVSTEWENATLQSTVIKSMPSDCDHKWVYAQFEDVNPWKVRPVMSPTLNDCNCACEFTHNEARICRVCKRHESRVTTIGYERVTKISEYKTLLDRSKYGQ